MNRRLTIIGFVAVLLLSSCYKEDEVTSSLGRPLYTIEDSDDPVDHFRYEFLQKCGVYILYDYTELDYQWNINALLDCRFVKQEDKTVLKEGLDYMQKVLFDYYDDSFKTHYFPVKILMADSIVNYAYAGINDEVVFSGRNYLAIGRIREKLEEISADSLNNLKGIVNGNLWANGIYANGLLEIAPEFFEPGLEMYDRKIGETDDPNFDCKDFGFWTSSASGKAMMGPKQSEDVGDFVQMITSHTEAEMMELMKGYELLNNKYVILLNHLKKQYNIDLQAIGNKKPTVLSK